MYNRIALIDPHVEVMLRKLYWNNIKFFKSFKPKNVIAPKDTVSWDKVLNYLEHNGVKKGALLLLHSSYEPLWPAKISPPEVIRSLRALLGDDGTLAMPVIRTYEGEPPIEKVLSTDTSNLICTYNIKSSKITSGVLPFFLTREKDVIISRNPLNTMAAVGKLAVPMMAENIIEDNLPPCGKNSSWAFCTENDSIIVGLGIDLCHSLTITHVAADLYMDQWPIKNWYRKRIFDIVDGNFHKRISVLEREEFWGCYYLAALNYRKDLIKNNILISKVIGGVTVEIVLAKELLNFLLLRIHSGYPYCIPKKYFK